LIGTKIQFFQTYSVDLENHENPFVGFIRFGDKTCRWMDRYLSIT
jgi:hypothetical protein